MNHTLKACNRPCSKVCLRRTGYQQQQGYPGGYPQGGALLPARCVVWVHMRGLERCSISTARLRVFFRACELQGLSDVVRHAPAVSGVHSSATPSACQCPCAVLQSPVLAFYAPRCSKGRSCLLLLLQCPALCSMRPSLMPAVLTAPRCCAPCRHPTGAVCSGPDGRGRSAGHGRGHGHGAGRRRRAAGRHAAG